MKKIREVSMMSGISRRTLQYYDDEGILPVERTKENYRLYDEKALRKLWEILIYKEIGLSIKQTKAKCQRMECFKQTPLSGTYIFLISNSSHLQHFVCDPHG